MGVYGEVAYVRFGMLGGGSLHVRLGKVMLEGIGGIAPPHLVMLRLGAHTSVIFAPSAQTFAIIFPVDFSLRQNFTVSHPPPENSPYPLNQKVCWH